MTATDDTKKWPANVPVPETKPELNLSGEDGNAFFIIGRARRAAKKADWTKDQITAFCDLCMAGDYDNLLQTCMKYFDVS